jgi:hypothetical protein
VQRDGLGLTVIDAACDGKCDIDFVFDGGLERRICRAASWFVTAGLMFGLIFILRRRARLMRPATASYNAPHT